jgi:hypothetical protein
MKPGAIVSGALANKPGNGGNAWTRLSFVLGLRRLGFSVFFIEQIEQPSDDACRFFDAVCRRFGIEGALVANGVVPDELRERAEDAALLLNIGGHLTREPLKHAARVNVFLDDDPGYTQFWQAAGALGGRLAGHDFYFTYGQNVGRPGCTIPTAGIDWRATRPPVVLEEWPMAPDGDRDRLTTVASWRGGYERVEADGHVFGQKAHEFRKLLELPGRAPQRFEIALDIHPADGGDADLLRRHGWRLLDPGKAAGEPESFRRFVQGSGGEFSAAQGIYVETESGWFSDRTVGYLASGKPALVQETGFSNTLPVGEGLLSFRTLREAIEGAHRIEQEYDTHVRAARALAERYFDSDLVLGRLLEEVGLS